MKYNIIFGGRAGQGPNILSEVISEGLIDRGYYVFYSRDYQSLIRGGHNFNTLTFSDKPIHSNVINVDMLICLDDETLKIHKASLNKSSIVLSGQHENMYFAGVIYKLLGLDFFFLEKELKKLKNYEENVIEARKGYNAEKRKIELTPVNIKSNNLKFSNGNQAIAIGAVNSGLEYYYAYPMTPATPLMMELGHIQLDKGKKHKVIELENEIAVMMAAIGSSATGAISMVGTSGGGFDLMTEGLSMAGIMEIPSVVYIASRPGPSTGVATYTSQGDLNLALHSGHGEFFRAVFAPGDPLESIEMTNLCFYISQKYKIPCILLGDKHLGESKYTFENNPKMLEVNKSILNLGRLNSYESDKKRDNVATEDPEIIKGNINNRKKVWEEVKKECSKMMGFKVYGNKNSNNIIISWGSTKGAIVDSLENCDRFKLDAKFIQILFLEPFPDKIKEEMARANKIIIVETNSTGQLARLIAEKTGIIIEDKNKILKYDGRPFLGDELASEICKRLK